MCAETSGGVRLRKEVDSSSARTIRGQLRLPCVINKTTRTPQPVNAPSFELLERDFRRWRDIIEIQTVGILLLLVRCGCCICKLLSLVRDVVVRAPFGVGTRMGICAKHVATCKQDREDGNVRAATKPSKLVLMRDSGAIAINLRNADGF